MFAASLATEATKPRPHIVSKAKVLLGPDGPVRNFSKTPNELKYLIAGPNPKLSGAIQRDIIYIIQTETWGNPSPTKSEWAKLSLSEFGRACGGTDSGAISRALADLVNRGIIASDAPQADDQPTGALRAKNVTYRYKLTPEKWRDAPPYETPKVTKPAALAPEAEEQSNPAPRRRLCDTVTLKPGRKALPTPAAIEPKGATEPVSFRVEFENTGKDPVQVSASSTGDVLTVSVSSCLQAIAESPEKPPLSLPRQSVTTHDPFDGEDAAYFNGPAPPFETTLAGQFLAALNPLMLAEFDKVLKIPGPDAGFVAQIAARIGDLLTPDEFATYAARQIEKRRKARKLVTSGLLLSLADQARDAARAAQVAKKTPFPASTMPPLDPNACTECHGMGQDYSGQPQEPGPAGDEARRIWFQNVPDCPKCKGTGKKDGAK